MNIPRIIGTALICALPAVNAAASGGSTGTMDAIERASALVDTAPEKALSMADSILSYGHPDASESAAAHIVAGNASFSMGETSDGISSLRRALAYSRKAGDRELEVQALGDLGVMLRVARKPDSALLCYREALDIIRKYDAAPDDEAHILISIAILHTNTGRISEAVPFARKAVELAEKSDNMEVMMYAGSQAGIILYKAGFREEGIAIEKRIVAMAEHHDSPRYALKTYAQIMDMYLGNGQRDSVNAYLDKGNRLIGLVPEGSVESLGFLEESYVVLADMGRHSESLEIQKRILSMKDAGTYMPLDKLWLRIARNYRALGQYGPMTEAYERSIALTDSLRNSDIDRQLSEFNVKYDTIQKDLAISRLESQRATDRMWLTVWISLAVITASGAVAIIMIRRRREATEKIRANLQGIEQERARLARELHDGVCNDLYGVSLLLQTRDTDLKEIIGDVGRIREDVRHISHELMPPQFGDTNLDILLRSYAARSGDFFTYRSEGTPGVTEEEAYELYRIVQELCGNILTHSGAESAAITADFNGHDALITVRYRPGRTSTPGDGNGIGLATMRRRAELIHAIVDTQADSDTVTVNIKLRHH